MKQMDGIVPEPGPSPIIVVSDHNQVTYQSLAVYLASHIRGASFNGWKFTSHWWFSMSTGFDAMLPLSAVDVA